MNISLFFNVKDLTPDQHTFEPPLLPASAFARHQVPCIPHILEQKDVIDVVLDNKIATSFRGGGYQQFFIK